MNRYILIHRLTGPAILLLLGTVALLHQAHLVRWTIFVPLLLILIGVIKLAERAVLAGQPLPPVGQYPADPYQVGAPYAGSPYQGSQYPGTQYSATPQPTAPAEAVAPTSIESPAHDFGNDPEGGK
jgi:hypothetical protein